MLKLKPQLDGNSLSYKGDEMKKIAVIGTHGVGKTTLCRGLYKYLLFQGKSVEEVGEVVRDCPFPLHEKMVYETAEWIALVQIIRERMVQMREPDYIICDRSAYDPLPYLQCFRDETAPYNQDLHYSLWIYLTTYLKTYHTIVFVAPDGKKIEEDGFRNTNEGMQQKVHTVFHEELLDFSIEDKGTSPSEYPYIIAVDSSEIFEDLDGLCKKIIDREDL
jgi:GTPase SAR1 family protein